LPFNLILIAPSLPSHPPPILIPPRHRSFARWSPRPLSPRLPT